MQFRTVYKYKAEEIDSVYIFDCDVLELLGTSFVKTTIKIVNKGPNFPGQSRNARLFLKTVDYLPKT